jgi:hypothetical protein
MLPLLDGIPGGRYIGAALLMPAYSMKLLAGETAMREAKQPPVSADSDLRRAIVARLIRRWGLRTGGSRPAPALGLLVES